MSRIQLSSELELNDVFGQEVTEFVTQRPLDFVELSARKFVYFWWMSPQAGLLYPSTWLAAYGLYAVVILTFIPPALQRSCAAAVGGKSGVLATISFVLACIPRCIVCRGPPRWGVRHLSAAGCPRVLYDGEEHLARRLSITALNQVAKDGCLSGSAPALMVPDSAPDRTRCGLVRATAPPPAHVARA
jgi:hypothetical protein